MIYRVSYMVRGDVRGQKHPGLMRDEDKAPEVGNQIELEGDLFHIIEVQEVLPPMGGFTYLHATCQWVPEESPQDEG